MVHVDCVMKNNLLCNHALICSEHHRTIEELSTENSSKTGNIKYVLFEWPNTERLMWSIKNGDVHYYSMHICMALSSLDEHQMNVLVNAMIRGRWNRIDRSQQRSQQRGAAECRTHLIDRKSHNFLLYDVVLIISWYPLLINIDIIRLLLQFKSHYVQLISPEFPV